MTYESFLKILPGISELILSNHSHSNEGTLKYLLKHLMMVYEHKIAQSIEQKYVEFDNTFTSETVEYLEKLNPNLYTIYKVDLCSFSCIFQRK